MRRTPRQFGPVGGAGRGRWRRRIWVSLAGRDGRVGGVAAGYQLATDGVSAWHSAPWGGQAAASRPTVSGYLRKHQDRHLNVHIRRSSPRRRFAHLRSPGTGHDPSETKTAMDLHECAIYIVAQLFKICALHIGRD